MKTLSKFVALFQALLAVTILWTALVRFHGGSLIFGMLCGVAALALLGFGGKVTRVISYILGGIQSICLFIIITDDSPLSREIFYGVLAVVGYLTILCLAYLGKNNKLIEDS